MKRLVFLLFFIIGKLCVFAQLQINEIMQSNIDCIMDDLNEFPDSWVELYNTGDNSINLKDYEIGNSNNAAEAWQLPDSVIDSHSFVVLFCDKVGSGIHSDFRLETGKGCNIYLFNEDTLIDSLVNLKKQPAPNVAYGRLNEEDKEYGYQAYPSPGTVNCGSSCDDVLEAPIFGVPGRVVFNEEPFLLTLDLPDGSPSEAAIYYTLDGSEPTKESLKYISPIEISGTTIVRAKVFCEGYLSKRSMTQSYIFPGRNVSLPVISLVTNKDYLYDSNIGIYTNGSYQEGKPNFKFDWRRPVNFEYFDKDFEKSCLNQLVEMRVFGGYSRTFDLKSLVVYANKRFGTKRFNYEFFPEDKPGISDFKSLILRNAGNDYYGLYMRDAIIQRMMGKNVDLDWQAWQPAIVYINGEYKGILNIRERSDEDNIYSNYGGLEDIDLVETWFTLKEGTIDNYDNFFKFYRAGGHSLSEYEEYMDCNEFMNLMIMNLFFDNKDFPANNIVLWRSRNDDGKWRFIAKDCDFGLGLTNDASYNTLEWVFNYNYDPVYRGGNMQYGTVLFSDIMKDSVFRERFIDCASVYMGDFLNYAEGKNIFDKMYNLIREEYEYHQSLYDSIPAQTYSERFSEMEEWLRNRPYYFYNSLKDKYKLGELVDLSIHLSDDAQVKMNGVPLRNRDFYGCFFQGRSINLSSTAKFNWRVTCETEDGTLSTREFRNCDSFELEVPFCNKLDIQNFGNSTSIFNSRQIEDTFSIYTKDKDLVIDNIQSNDQVCIYNASGTIIYSISNSFQNLKIPLTTIGKGIFIVRIGSYRKKIII